VLTVAIPHPLHVPHGNARDLARLDPTQLLRRRLQDHFLQFHNPLRFSRWYRWVRCFHLARFPPPGSTG
jgi:hypothetical protein